MSRPLVVPSGSDYTLQAGGTTMQAGAPAGCGCPRVESTRELMTWGRFDYTALSAAFLGNSAFDKPALIVAFVWHFTSRERRR